MRKRSTAAAALAPALLGLLVLLQLRSRWRSARRAPPGSLRFSVGDHVYINRGGYDHHGIVYATDGSPAGIITRVAHVISAAGDLEDMANNTFILTGLDRFLRGSPYQAVRRMRYGATWSETVLGVHAYPLLPDPPSVILARMQWLLRHAGRGVGRYSILGQNCEHAAHWCRTGQQWSRQSLVVQREAAPFSAEEDPALVHEIAALREAALRTLPEEGDIVSLRLQSSGVAVALSPDGSAGFLRRPWASFRVRRATVGVVGDPRSLVVFGFQCADSGCFLGESQGRLVCRAQGFGRSEWFAWHLQGTLQHFESGSFVVPAAGGALLRPDEQEAAVFRWPLYVRLRAWRRQMAKWLALTLAGFAALSAAVWLWRGLHAVEPLLHVLHLVLLLLTCATFWTNGEPAAFAAVVACCCLCLPVGQARAAPSWGLPAAGAGTCLALSSWLLWRAHRCSDPAFTAAAHALLACLVLWVLLDVALAARACRRRSGARPPSRMLAAATVPVLLVSGLAAPALGHAVPQAAVLLRSATAAAGMGRLAYASRVRSRGAVPREPPEPEAMQP
mmetsp:Transcript_6151/g.19361  ORF Transcript_6151/g.19361 Transcript_6151/m.19361 type:complete len:561 (-) Transcript_6151:140-1822(-)